MEIKDQSIAPPGLADVLRKSGFQSLQVLIQDGGKEEDGFVFRLKRDQDVRSALAPASCMIKLFTANMIAELIAQGKLRLDQNLSHALKEHCRFDGEVPEELSSVTILNLLAHTHGLGSSQISIAPCGEDGFIELSEVLAHIRLEGSLFPPGSFHSYANVGYHILGVLLEAISGRRFSSILEERVLAVLQAGSQHSAESLYFVDSQRICPASGGGLYVSGRLLFLFATALLKEGGRPFGLSEEIVCLLMKPVVQTPSWSPFMAGAALGWKDYGNGWCGHNGATQNSILLLRINKDGDHIVAISGTSNSGSGGLSTLSMSMVRRKFPSLREASPAAIKPSAIESHGEEALGVGRFGGRFLRYVITDDDNGIFLKIEKAEMSANFASVHSCPLIRGENLVLYLERPWKRMFFVQVLCNKETGRRYLWDHECVWPEI